MLLDILAWLILALPVIAFIWFLAKNAPKLIVLLVFIGTICGLFTSVVWAVHRLHIIG